MGQSPQMRLQITPSPNPPVVGIEAFDLWTADPRHLLQPIAHARVTLIAVPPKGLRAPVDRTTAVTDANGKGEARLGFGIGGAWTLKAIVASPKNGRVTFSASLPVGNLPGQPPLQPGVSPPRPGPTGPRRGPLPRSLLPPTATSVGSTSTGSTSVGSTSTGSTSPAGAPAKRPG